MAVITAHLKLNFYRIFGRMRIFSTILALLILVMNFKPCADEIVSKDARIYTLIQKANDHADHSEDDCSPFCYCACCSVRSLSAQTAKAVVFLPKANLPQADFVIGQVHQISLPIWQPPQLG